MKRDNSYLIGNQFAKGTKPNSTSFKKGNAPWNKGLKGIHLSPKTEFQKGHIGDNFNKKPVGEITIRVDKSKKERRWIKIAEPNKWVLYAIWIWTTNHGLISKGLITHHLDGNTLNDDIKNIALATRSAHINLHRNDLLKGKATKPTAVISSVKNKGE